jgi:hypothetical protein
VAVQLIHEVLEAQRARDEAADVEGRWGMVRALRSAYGLGIGATRHVDDGTDAGVIPEVSSVRIWR